MPEIVTVTDVTIPPGSPVSPRRVGGQRVYTKELSWVDDWVLQEDLFCTESVWVAAPSISTATLTWHYGRIALPGQATFAEVFRRRNPSNFRIYVKIEYDMQFVDDQWTTRTWHGVIEVDEDLLHGEILESLLNNRLATGEQTLTCYGFEQLLDQQFVNKAYWDPDTEDDIGEIHRPVIFNRDGKPNRSAAQVNGVFHFSKDKATAAAETSTVKWWSSRDIFEYLLHYHTPRDYTGFEWLPWKIEYDGHEGAIPDWDHPTVDPSNRSVLSLLSSLCPRQRLASFYLTVVDGEDPEEDPQEVAVRPFTFTGEEVETLENADPIPANQNQIRILAQNDQSGEVVVKTSIAEKYDQVIAQGAFRRSVCTLAYEHSTLEPGWETADEVLYEAGASNSTGYVALDWEDQRQRNADVRAHWKLRNVYSRFAIPDAWRGEVHDDDQAAFPDDEDPPGVFPQYWPELFIERTMPLIEGVDYTGNVIDLGTVDETIGTGNELGPLVFWKQPGSNPERFTNIERLAKDSPHLDDAENFDWSAQVSVPEFDRAIRLNVSGAPQHAVAFPNFAPLPIDEEFGEGDWTEMFVTCSLQDDRRASGKYPPDEEVVITDYQQVLWLPPDESFLCDYVVPGTVVDVDDDGALIESTGGYLHDDREELETVARIAWTFYSRERRVLTLGTDQLTEEVEIGDYVTELNQQDATWILDGGSHYFAIATPITEIRINTAEGEANAPPSPPRMRIATDFGQLDSLQLVKPEMQREFRSTVFDDPLPRGDRHGSDADYTIHFTPYTD